jgi:hypothetical protein
MPTYRVNEAGVAKARELIDAHQYDLRTSWSEEAPSADEGNAQLERHGYDGYGQWYLAIDADASEETKERYRFPYGDFRRVNRAGLVHAMARAAQNDHDAVTRATDELLAHLDEVSGKGD